VRKASWLRYLPAGALAAAVVYAASGVPLIAVLTLVCAVLGPQAARRRAQRRSEAAVRAAWPTAIDDTISGIRAGTRVHEAVLMALSRMPAPLPDIAAAASADMRATGQVDEVLRWLGLELRDPVADKLVLAVRITRELGAADIISVLEDLSAAVRQDIELSSSIEARRSWVTASAGVATAAPWITVLALSVRAPARAAYASATGSAVLASAALLSWLAYVAMRRLGRIAEPARLVPR